MRALVAFALVFATATAYGEGDLAAVRARGKLVVSVKNDAKHPHKDPAHADKRGFEIELARAIARHIFGDPARLELRLLARPARLPMLEAGAVDLVISMIPVTPENAARVRFSHSYFSSGLSLLTRADRKLALSDLAGHVVAFRKQSYNDYGGELGRVASAQGIAVEVRYYPSFEAAVAAVTSGEAVAVGGNFVDLDAWARAHAGFAVDARLIAERPVAVAVARPNVELLGGVNDTIDELVRTGELRRMTQKWHLPYLLPNRAP